MKIVDSKWTVWHILNNIICCCLYCIFLNSVWDTAREKFIYLKNNLLKSIVREAYIKIKNSPQ